MIVPRCKFHAGGKVTIQAGSFFFGPGCEMHGNEAVELTVGTGVNHGSITAGQNNERQPIFAPTIRPSQESGTTTLMETTSTSLSEYSTANFTTTASLTSASSISAESLPLILVAILLNYFINRL